VPTPRGEVTRLLSQLRAGDPAAEERLFAVVLDELHGLARAVFSGQRPGHTLQPTALVSEAWLKLTGNLGSVEGRRHFFLLAGRAMRQVVADHARAQGRVKRGDRGRRVTLDTDVAEERGGSVDLVELDECLARLAENNERHARVAEMRIFCGLTIEETATTLGLSARSVDSDWAMAKAWLRRELV
jgi:RNA polymerase sigma factor (TIGR02999 family)